MSNETRSFPSNYMEALAILYLQSRDLSGKTPEEIEAMYWDAMARLGKRPPQT